MSNSVDGTNNIMAKQKNLYMKCCQKPTAAVTTLNKNSPGKTCAAVDLYETTSAGNLHG